MTRQGKIRRNIPCKRPRIRSDLHFITSFSQAKEVKYLRQEPSRALYLGKIDWTMKEIFPTLDIVPVAHHGTDSSLFQIPFQGLALESGNWGVPSVLFSWNVR